ncbi:MAG: hypothetical protein EZS28_049852, partial [Streblomastix strix]
SVCLTQKVGKRQSRFKCVVTGGCVRFSKSNWKIKGKQHKGKDEKHER